MPLETRDLLIPLDKGTASLGSVTVTTGTTYPKFNAAVRAIREPNYTWMQSVESFSHMLDEALHHSKLAFRLSDLTCIELWIAQSQPHKPQC